MEIDIFYQNRELTFKSPKESGEGFEDFLRLISENKDKITCVRLSGESKSYTFTRQVFLLVNLLKNFLDCDLYINSKKIEKEIALPIYG
ncbi:MAG: hypothetical protein NTZ65_02390 [Candidatus Berkelbacteria bacterium]|nr:hypothetical protein [Candidatus Berkelbacteria bacterium]